MASGCLAEDHSKCETFNDENLNLKHHKRVKRMDGHGKESEYLI